MKKKRFLLILGFVFISIILMSLTVVFALSHDQENDNQIGYEFLNLQGNVTNSSQGEVVHIWNTQDDYYFNKSSGIQFTNHFEDYWTHNVFCIGYYNNGHWNKIHCADELNNFNRQIDSDDLTYVNATLWKDFNYGGYDFRFGIKYHLGLNDKNLTIEVYGENIGDDDIPFPIGFEWKMKDWEIHPDYEDDVIDINHTIYPMDGTYNLSFKNLSNTNFFAYNGLNTEYLKLSWDKNLDYEFLVDGNGSQDGFISTLIINGGLFDSGQSKSTKLYWIDAVVMGNNSGFVAVAPTSDPDSGTITLDDAAHVLLDTSPADATSITEVGIYFETSSEASNMQFGLYAADGVALPGEAGTLLYNTGDVTKPTSAGWFTQEVNWAINGSTNYWLGVQLDDTTTDTEVPRAFSGANGRDRKSGDTELVDPFNGGSSLTDVDGTFAYYALYSTSGGGDTTAPTYSNNNVNNTVVSLSTNFSLNVSDDTALESLGYYIFSTNNTGVWVNDSAVNFTSTPQTISSIKDLNDTEGISIGYRWYLFDNASNSNSTEIFALTTTGADSCSYTSGNWKINCSDNCIISSDVDLIGNNISLSGSGTFEINNGVKISNWTYRKADATCYVKANGNGGFYH